MINEQWWSRDACECLWFFNTCEFLKNISNDRILGTCLFKGLLFFPFVALFWESIGMFFYFHVAALLLLTCMHMLCSSFSGMFWCFHGSNVIFSQNNWPNLHGIVLLLSENTEGRHDPVAQSLMIKFS